MDIGDFAVLGVGAVILAAMIISSRRIRWIVKETFRHPFAV